MVRRYSGGRAGRGRRLEHAAAKSFSSVVFSCPELKIGETYVLSAGEQTVEIALTETSTDSGASAR